METLKDLLIFIRGLSPGEFTAFFIIAVLIIIAIDNIFGNILNTIKEIFKR